ncbi:MAG: immune inhibitor A, partial [Candidatus Marinimicrobia bacterium]|nr:immune inhibitor A [Candidatus Neomarinimicrobiota bacterium]
MKSSFKVLVLTFIAISAFAHSVEELQQTRNQIIIQSANQTLNTETRVAEPGMIRDLRNGNFALACQTEDFTYLPGMLNYIYSPVIPVPAGNSVSFDFYVKGSFSDLNAFPEVDYWGCEVSPDAGATWYAISNPYGDPTGSNYVYSDAPAEWSSFVQSYTVDGILNDYAGTSMQFRWYFQSDTDTPIGEGIFVDDVSLTVDGTSVFFTDFEDGDLTGWVSVDGTAEPAHFHQTTVGAYAGQSWAMNDPELGTAGGYGDHWYQVLDSPPVTLPDVAGNTITFQQNRNVEGTAGATTPYNGWDGTNVRISRDGGVTWDVLNSVSPAYNATSLYSFGYEFGEGAGIGGW